MQRCLMVELVWEKERRTIWEKCDKEREKEGRKCPRLREVYM